MAGLALLCLAGCGGTDTLQVLWGVASPSRVLDTPERVQVQDTAGQTVAQSPVDAEGAFTLAVRDGGPYVLVAVGERGPTRIGSLDGPDDAPWSFWVCRPIEPLQLELVPPDADCARAPDCEAAISTLQQCQRTHAVRCDPLAAQAQRCRVVAGDACATEYRFWDGCRIDDDIQACLPELAALDRCLQPFDCDGRESVWVQECTAPCGRARQQVSACLESSECDVVAGYRVDAPVALGCGDDRVARTTP